MMTVDSAATIQPSAPGVRPDKDGAPELAIVQPQGHGHPREDDGVENLDRHSGRRPEPIQVEKRGGWIWSRGREDARQQAVGTRAQPGGCERAPVPPLPT